MSGASARVLIVDDERPTRFLMERELPRAGFQVTPAESGEEALERLREREFDVVLLDLKMPGMGGMEALRRIRESGATAEVVVLTGHPDVSTAIDAMKLGAYDYLTKPFKLAEVEVVLRRAADRKRLQRENLALRRMVAQREGAPEIIGQSAAMARLLEAVERIAATDANVVIEGESGTGKGLIAQAIHQRSRRAEGAFLAINCGGFQDALLESELFGHEKGAFTGATVSKPGLFEVAEGGTLFLDEVAEMSAAMQAKLLQVLDSRELRRLGGTRVQRVDVRIIAATNKRLAEEVKAGRFREDLYYRLNVVSLTLPSLRERPEDIPLLVEHFVARLHVSGGAARRVSPEAMAVLARYAWPGNVRELANMVERLMILAPGEVIQPGDLPPALQSSPGAVIGPPSPVALVDVERQHIAHVLQQTGGKKMQAARLLGIDLKTLNKKIKDYGIEMPGTEPRAANREPR